MKIGFVLSQYNVVDREFGYKDGKLYNYIYYGNGWPGIFGGNYGVEDPWWKRLYAVRLRVIR